MFPVRGGEAVPQRTDPEVGQTIDEHPVLASEEFWSQMPWLPGPQGTHGRVILARDWQETRRQIGFFPSLWEYQI